MLYLKHIDLTRLGTESGAADYLRSAHPAEAATAKVFANFFQGISKKTFAIAGSVACAEL